MTVASTQSRKTFAGNGVTTSFATSPVIFYDTSDLVVYVTTDSTGASTTLTEGTHYSVTGGSGAVGTVSLAGGASPYGAPASGTTLVIDRRVPATQSSDFVQNDASDAEVVERALDRLTLLSQQNKSDIARAVSLSASDVSGLDPTLPTPVAGKAIGINANGDGLALYDLEVTVVTASVTISAFGETLVDDANASAALTTLGFSAYGKTIIDDADAAATRTTLAAAGSGAVTASGLTMTTAKMLGRSTASTGAIEEITVGDGLTLSGGTLSSSGSLPRSYLAGLTLSNNGSDATNDIDIAVGECRDSTNAADIVLASALTKQLDAAWSVGTAAGGLDTGSIANTTYFVWLIKRSDTGVVDALFSASASAPTMPANYDYKRRIGAILRESAAIVAFTQYGDEFMRTTPVLDVDATNPGTSAVSRTLSVPTGVAVTAIVNVLAVGGSNNLAVYLSALTAADTAAALNAAPLGLLATPGTGTSQNTATQARVWTNTTAQIRSRLSLSGASDVLRIATLGWVDRRGRDA